MTVKVLFIQRAPAVVEDLRTGYMGGRGLLRHSRQYKEVCHRWEEEAEGWYHCKNNSPGIPNIENQNSLKLPPKGWEPRLFNLSTTCLQTLSSRSPQIPHFKSSGETCIYGTVNFALFWAVLVNKIYIQNREIYFGARQRVNNGSLLSFPSIYICDFFNYLMIKQHLI